MCKYLFAQQHQDLYSGTHTPNSNRHVGSKQKPLKQLCQGTFVSKSRGPGSTSTTDLEVWNEMRGGVSEREREREREREIDRTSYLLTRIDVGNLTIDGFCSTGGTVISQNLLFNTCGESGDHGAINTWDRQAYLTTVATGIPSCVAAMPVFDLIQYPVYPRPNLFPCTAHDHMDCVLAWLQSHHFPSLDRNSISFLRSFFTGHGQDVMTSVMLNLELVPVCTECVPREYEETMQLDDISASLLKHPSHLLVGIGQQRMRFTTIS